MPANSTTWATMESPTGAATATSADRFQEPGIKVPTNSSTSSTQVSTRANPTGMKKESDAGSVRVRMLRVILAARAPCGGWSTGNSLKEPPGCAAAPGRTAHNVAGSVEQSSLSAPDWTAHTQENAISNAANTGAPAPAYPSSAALSSAAQAHPVLDWRTVDLVVFDVDGTLYDQRRLRLRMVRELLRDAVRTRSLGTLRTLRRFRHVREALGDAPVDDFMLQQYARTAALCRSTPEQVEALAAEWMEQRPLAFIADCRYPHVERLFERLQALGKGVAVFSDYPAIDKLKALGLRAEPVVCATDSAVARLKPDPFGLLHILAQTGVNTQRALMIGDRFDRDAAAARQVGMRALIRSARPHPEFLTFRGYDDAVFAPLWAGDPGNSAP